MFDAAYNIEDLEEGMRRDVSILASRTLDDDGNPMYDALRIRSQDASEVRDHVREALGDVAQRFNGRAFLSFRTLDVDGATVRQAVLSLDYPGATDGARASAHSFLRHAVERKAAARWFDLRHAEVATALHKGAADDMDAAVRRLSARDVRPRRPAAGDQQ